jgi:hypothetical protein
MVSAALRADASVFTDPRLADGFLLQAVTVRAPPDDAVYAARRRVVIWAICGPYQRRMDRRYRCQLSLSSITCASGSRRRQGAVPV